MIKLIIINSLRNEIYKTFKGDFPKVISLIKSVRESPNKGKNVSRIGDIVIRELKYNTFRFYYIFSGHKLFLFNKSNVSEVLVKFVKMSKKNNQQKTIDQIKDLIEEMHFDEIN